MVPASRLYLLGALWIVSETRCVLGCGALPRLGPRELSKAVHMLARPSPLLAFSRRNIRKTSSSTQPHKANLLQNYPSAKFCFYTYPGSSLIRTCSVLANATRKVRVV